MTLADLIRDFRRFADDTVGPDYLFGQQDVIRWLIEAEQEACIRGRLLHESSDPAVCEIDVSAGEAVYPLASVLYELTHLGFVRAGQAERCHVQLVSTEWLDGRRPGWRDRTGAPGFAIQGDTSLRLVPMPDGEGTLKLEGYRLPLRGLTDQPASTPEIMAAHHRFLVHWALHKAFSIPDAETEDPGRAEVEEATFTRYFGLRPNSDLRRITREDVPHHVEAYWP